MPRPLVMLDPALLFLRRGREWLERLDDRAKASVAVPASLAVPAGLEVARVRLGPQSVFRSRPFAFSGDLYDDLRKVGGDGMTDSTAWQLHFAALTPVADLWEGLRLGNILVLRRSQVFDALVAAGVVLTVRGQASYDASWSQVELQLGAHADALRRRTRYVVVFDELAAAPAVAVADGGSGSYR